MIPFITSRTSTWRLLPPRLAGGIKGSTCAHSSSVRSLGYRNLLRSSRPRFFAVHIGGAPLESGHHFEPQMIQRIQNVFGRTLRAISGVSSRMRREDQFSISSLSLADLGGETIAGSHAVSGNHGHCAAGFIDLTSKPRPP